MSAVRAVSLLALGALVVGSALAIVHARAEGRGLFRQLDELERERDRLEVEWGRLQLEQSTWATHNRIERVARERLHMRLPRAAEIEIVRP